MTAGNPEGRIRGGLDVLASVVMIVAAVFLIAGRVAPGNAPEPSTTPVPTEPVSLEGATVEGASTASVVLLEFADFQCGFCGQFASQTEPLLRKEYVEKGQVLLAFRHFPLGAHERAIPAAEAAACAGQQGQFRTWYSALFRDPSRLTTEPFFVEGQGVDRAKFDECIEAKADGAVDRDLDEGRKLRVTGTPTFFIGRRLPDTSFKVSTVLKGAQAVDVFREALNSLLDEVRN
jgi:protein-disulfide isomerase